MGKKAALTVLSALIVLSACMANFGSADAQTLEGICINPDGSVTGTQSIKRDGNRYTLTGNVSGGIQVQKSYIVINGADYTVDGEGQGIGVDLGNGRGQKPSRTMINNVTVINLKIINCASAIGSENTHNNTFIGNYIENCDTGFWITGSSNNTLLRNTIKNCTTGISINYGSGGNVITENNILSSWSVWLSPEPIVDRNYWGDYTSRFPDAKEIDDSGIWDTPYSHGGAVIDYHPLTKPTAVSAQEKPEVTEEENTATVTKEPFPTIAALATIAVAVLACIGFVAYFKKHRQTAKRAA